MNTLRFYIKISFILLGFSNYIASQSNQVLNNQLIKSLTFDISADGRYGFGSDRKGFQLGEIRFRTTYSINKNFNFVAIFRSRVPVNIKWDDWKNRINEFSEIYLHYFDFFNIEFLRLSLNSKIGKVEYFPKFEDTRLIVENFDLYLRPPQFYGATLTLNITTRKLNFVSFFFDGISGDITDFNSLKPDIKELVFRFYPTFFKDFSFYSQIGRSLSSIHVINYAYFIYSPGLFNYFNFSIKLGKLPALDAAPYGVRFTIEREFNFLLIGGYYERRINQPPGGSIIGFYWRILKPDELVEIFGAYRFMYDSNAGVLAFNIPFLLIRVNF